MWREHFQRPLESLLVGMPFGKNDHLVVRSEIVRCRSPSPSAQVFINLDVPPSNKIVQVIHNFAYDPSYFNCGPHKHPEVDRRKPDATITAPQEVSNMQGEVRGQVFVVPELAV